MNHEAQNAFNVALEILNDLNESGMADRIICTSKEAFMSLIGTVVDSYGSANGMSSEGVIAMMTLLLKTMHDVHNELGGL